MKNNSVFSFESKRNKIGVFTVVVGLFLNLGMAMGKLFIGLASNSVCVTTDATNNFLDVVSCIITVFAFVSVEKATEKYPYGKGRMEYVCSFLISAIIVVLSALFAYNALSRLTFPVPVFYSERYLWILVATVIVKLLMGFGYRVIAKKTKSSVMNTLALDSFLDTAVTTMTVISFLLIDYSILRADAVFGVVISVVILIGGIKAFIESINKLLGKADKELLKAISEYLSSKGYKVCSLSMHDYGKNSIYGYLIIADDCDCVDLEKELNTLFNVKMSVSRREGEEYV